MSSTSGNYKRSKVTANKVYDVGPYEAIVVNHLDRRFMGGLEVELVKYTGSGNTPESAGQLVQVRYLSPFYGVTPGAGLTANDGYQHTQKSYGMWMVPPDIGTRVLVIFVEGNLNLGYWIGCVPDDYMNFMVPDGRASTEITTALTPDGIKGSKLPVGEYNKAFEDGSKIDPTLFSKPYNKDFTEVLETQGLLFDEVREKDNLVYSISSGKNYDQKIPIELMSFYTYFESDPKNIDKIKDKIDLVISKIKTKDFDLQIFKDQKLALKNSYKSSLRSNGFWLNVLTDARQHNLSIERITNTDAMLKSISLNDIVRLAEHYFDENYTRSVMLLAE